MVAFYMENLYFDQFLRFFFPSLNTMNMIQSIQHKMKHFAWNINIKFNNGKNWFCTYLKLYMAESLLLSTL